MLALEGDVAHAVGSEAVVGIYTYLMLYPAAAIRLCASFSMSLFVAVLFPRFLATSTNTTCAHA
jgi:hypothetical protein